MTDPTPMHYLIKARDAATGEYRTAYAQALNERDAIVAFCNTLCGTADGLTIEGTYEEHDVAIITQLADGNVLNDGELIVDPKRRGVPTGAY